MDNNQTLDKFGEVEERVHRLIESRKSLEKEISELKDYIEQLEIELQKKIDAEKSYADEKSLISSKIEGLLEKLGEVPDMNISDSVSSE